MIPIGDRPDLKFVEPNNPNTILREAISLLSEDTGKYVFLHMVINLVDFNYRNCFSLVRQRRYWINFHEISMQQMLTN